MNSNQHLFDLSTAYKKTIAPHLFDREIPNITTETINQTALKTRLNFILAKDPEGNVCMANNREIRPEFRQNFTPTDMLDYTYAIMHSSKFGTAKKEYLENNFPAPKNAEMFWDLALLGSKIKQIHSFQSIKTEDIHYSQKLTMALSETEKLVTKIDKIMTEYSK